MSKPNEPAYCPGVLSFLGKLGVYDPSIQSLFARRLSHGTWPKRIQSTISLFALSELPWVTVCEMHRKRRAKFHSRRFPFASILRPKFVHWNRRKSRTLFLDLEDTKLVCRSAFSLTLRREAQFFNADGKPGSIWPHVYYGAFCQLH